MLRAGSHELISVAHVLFFRRFGWCVCVCVCVCLCDFVPGERRGKGSLRNWLLKRKGHVFPFAPEMSPAGVCGSIFLQLE